MNIDSIFIPISINELMDKMKENKFKGEIDLEGEIINWQIGEKKCIQIIFENQPDEAYIILLSGVQDHVPHNELWEYLVSLNDELE